MRLIADRENDNAALVEWNEQAYRLTVRPEPRLGAVNIWARFRAENIEPGRELTLNLQGLDPCSGFVPLYLNWDDGRTWCRTTSAESPHTISVESPTLEVSRNLPFGYTDLMQWRAELVEQAPLSMRLETLCQSRQHRDIPMLATDAPAPDAPLVWVQARSHAFESHSSRLAAAFTRWLLGDEGQRLCEGAMVCVIPMIDVDAVAMGSAGKGRSPHDPNRDYVQEHYPQVAAIKRRLTALVEHHPLAFFIDVHSPWYYNKCQWYVTPQEEAHFAPLTDGFMQELARTGAANSWHNEFVDYTRVNVVRDPRYLGASRWVRQTWPAALATTMEVAHDQDADGRSISPQGLEDYARALGRVFVSQLSNSARA